jgi:hypothetical protein
MVHMVTRLCAVLSCLLVASLGGCGGGSQATIPPDAHVATGGSDRTPLHLALLDALTGATTWRI